MFLVILEMMVLLADQGNLARLDILVGMVVMALMVLLVYPVFLVLLGYLVFLGLLEFLALKVNQLLAFLALLEKKGTVACLASPVCLGLLVVTDSLVKKVIAVIWVLLALEVPLVNKVLLVILELAALVPRVIPVIKDNLVLKVHLVQYPILELRVLLLDL